MTAVYRSSLRALALEAESVVSRAAFRRSHAYRFISGPLLQVSVAHHAIEEAPSMLAA